MTKVNFTKEHRERLGVLSAEALVKGTPFKVGGIGSELNIYDLFHNCTVNTLVAYNGTLKKQITDIENLDEWSLTEHQQNKAAGLKKTQEMVNLLIGYQRYQAQLENQKAELSALKSTQKELLESTKTPQDRLNEVAAKIAELEAAEA